MYAGQAETAVANGDYDTACACYTRALQLYDDCNKWKLALAGILIYHSGAVTPDTTVQYSQPSYLLANLINPTPDDEATMNSLRAKI